MVASPNVGCFLRLTNTEIWSLEEKKKRKRHCESFEEQRKKVYKTLSPKTKIKRSKIWRLVHLINKGYWGGFSNELPWKKERKKKKKKKKCKTEVSRNKEIQSFNENDIRNIVLKKQRNKKSQETKKKNVWRYKKKMKQNMAVSTSQWIKIIDVFSQIRCLVAYSVFVYIWG